MQKIILFLALLLAMDNLRASSEGYPVSLISDSLKVDAYAVVREESYDYTYNSQQHNSMKVKKVITVLNRKGEQLAVFNESYDKFRSLNITRANLYDAAGKLIRKIKDSEIKDFPRSNYNEFNDIRYKSFAPMLSVFPYTFELEYTINYQGSFFFPTYIAFDGYNVAIEKISLQIHLPVDYKLNYVSFGFNPSQLKKDSTAYEKVFTWNAGNIKASDVEPFTDDLYKYFPTVLTSPSLFYLGGFNGTFNAWRDFGNWPQQMNEGRDSLTSIRASEIRDMVKDISDDREKVKILYKYMQSRTRYFGVQLGIGGFQTIDANIVDQNGYGDCKGLSNYMKALLNAVGINSYYTLVHAGEDFPQIVPGFAYDPFNHMILCVPLKKDTIWLECTSQVLPFNFLGDFTSDRDVLIIKKDGSKLVRTPEYTAEENFQYTHTRVNILPTGDGNAEMIRKFGGLQYDDKIEYLHCSNEDLKEWLYEYLSVPNCKVNKYEFKENSDGSPQSQLKYSFDLANYSSALGKRLFLPLNLTNRSTYAPPKTKDRKFDISFVMSYIDADTIEYDLPDGISIEFLPKNSEIKSIFGSYNTQIEQKGNKITYIRVVKRFKGKYPKEEYNNLIKFYYDISVADKCQAILIKNES